jgi:hypothetical protein
MYSSVSVDGFVADENDQPGQLFDWLSSGDVPLDESGEVKVSQTSYDYTRRYWDQIGATIVGRHVFDITEGWDGKPLAGVDHVVVVTCRRRLSLARELAQPIARPHRSATPGRANTGAGSRIPGERGTAARDVEIVAVWSYTRPGRAMFAKLKTWLAESRQRKRDRAAADYGSLGKEEQREVQRLREEHRGTHGELSPDRDFGNRPGT